METVITFKIRERVLRVLMDASTITRLQLPTLSLPQVVLETNILQCHPSSRLCCVYCHGELRRRAYTALWKYSTPRKTVSRTPSWRCSGQGCPGIATPTARYGSTPPRRVALGSRRSRDSAIFKLIEISFGLISSSFSRAYLPLNLLPFNFIRFRGEKILVETGDFAHCLR